MRIFLTIIVLLLTQVVMAQEAAPMERRTLTHDGLERVYHLYVPESLQDADSLPLIMALHPISSSGQAFAAMSNLNTVADEYGFAVAYPQSAVLYWDDGRVEVGIGPDQGAVDDQGFLNALRDELVETQNVDPEQVYMVGYDNGGGMAVRMACENPEQYAGVATVGFLMWDYHYRLCPAEPEAGAVDMLFAVGSNDEYYPVGGRTLERQAGAISIPGISNGLSFWVNYNGCDLDTTGRFQASEGDVPAANFATVTGCREDVTVAAYIVAGAGHNWPEAGEDGLRVDLTQVIMDFFTGEENWGSQAIVELGEEVVPTSLPRNYRYYVPSTYDPATPTPLLLVLHGRPDNGIGISYITDMNVTAEQEGFVVAYPDGINSGWFYAPEAEDQLSDPQFLVGMVDEISAEVNIDRQRVYVTGFSNGGFMTQALACLTEDEVFAAYAVVGATLYPTIDEDCTEEDPAVPIMFMHGTDDVSIPWEGQVTMSAAGPIISDSVPNTIDFWVRHNGCNEESDSRIDFPQNDAVTRVGLFTFSDCDDGSSMLFYAIDGGGHNWPGVPGRIGQQIAGNVTMDINASEEVWAFLSQYSLDG